MRVTAVAAAGLVGMLAACGGGAGAGTPGGPIAADDAIELSAALAAGRIEAFGREATAVTGETGVVRLDEREGSGVAWIDGVELRDGTIELDVRGRDMDGRSFAGVAFHGVSDSTYEGVYVRPFNWRQADPARRRHGIQYISHPAHPWHVLRESHPGRYEAEITPAPDPNDWVRLRLEIRHPTLRVYVNDAPAPALVVEQLGDQRNGRVGLWVGHLSPGDFRRLRVVPR